MDSRMIPGSPFAQGEDEQIARRITVDASWGSPPFTNLSTKVFDVQASMLDVTGTLASGSTTSSQNVITTPRISGLTRYKTYRVEVKFTTDAGNLMEIWFELFGEK